MYQRVGIIFVSASRGKPLFTSRQPQESRRRSIGNTVRWAGGSSTWYIVTDGMAAALVPADDAAAHEDVPALVRVLAGNPATSAAILACLHTADARHLRGLHPAVAGAVAAVPWCDMDTPVVDVVQWRAGLPGAVGAKIAPSARLDLLTSEAAAAALGGITHLDLRKCRFVTDDLLLRLPTSLRVLNVSGCEGLTAGASFTHLTALASLGCSWTQVLSTRTDGLPPSLQELNINQLHALRHDASLAHLSQLRVLRADQSRLNTITLVSLPPSLEEVHASYCRGLTAETTFAHLPALRKLGIPNSAIGDASLALLPPCLVTLHAQKCKNLTPAAVLPPLPALRWLDVSDTCIGDALVASLPPSLVKLRLTICHSVTAGASLDHLHALRVLRCIGTGLAPAALAACRARGCTVLSSTGCVLRGHTEYVKSLALLGDGRLVSGESDRRVRLWGLAAAGGDATTVVTGSEGNYISALTALQDGRRLTVGTASSNEREGCVEVWDVDGVPPARRAIIDCCSGVLALAVLPDGRLAAGCGDGAVRIVDVDAGAVTTTLSGHTATVKALAVLPDGTLASGSGDASVRVWNVGAGVCVATLTGHTNGVSCLAVLRDGRLASESEYGVVRLWDVGARTCVGVLPGHAGNWGAPMVALSDGRLATVSDGGTIRLWDTRPAAAGTAGATPVEVVCELGTSISTLLALPDGHLACGGGYSIPGFGGKVLLVTLELPPPAPYE